MQPRLPDLIQDLPGEAGFRSHVFARLLAALDNHEDGNLDLAYPADGAALDPKAYLHKRAAFLAFFSLNADKLYQTAALLQDDASRRLFVDLLLFRALGHERVRLASNTEAYWAAKAGAEALPAAPSGFADLPGSADLKQFRIEQDGRTLTVDCLRANMFFTFFSRQYFFTRGAVVIQPEAGDVVVDAGACFGDTALAFAQSTGPLGTVCAFEPVEAHLRILNHNIGQNGMGNILVYPTALGHIERLARPSQEAVDPGFSAAGPESGPVRSLDALVAEGALTRVDFLKMDIEGHELWALQGAEATLRRFTPKLAISLYHRWEDYFEIPAFIAQLGLGYAMYLENHTVSDGETILYCIRPAA